MASLAYQLMTTLGDAANAAKEQNLHGQAFALDTSVNTVNNFQHARYPKEWLPLVKTAVAANANASYSDEDEKAGYRQALALVEEFEARFAG